MDEGIQSTGIESTSIFSCNLDLPDLILIFSNDH